MKKRILTAREQFDMLSPWLITADLMRPSLRENDVPNPGTMVFPVQTTVPEPKPISEMKMIGQPGEPLVGKLPKTPSNDPANDPMGKLNNQRFTFEDMVNNLVSHFNGSNEDQRKRGRFWYKKAHDDFMDIAEATGISPQRAVSIGAAFSPLTDWGINLQHAKDFIKAFRYRDPDFNKHDWSMAHIHPQALQAFRDATGHDPSDSDEDIETLADMHAGLFKSGKTLDEVNDIVNSPKARQRWVDNIRHHGMKNVLADHESQAFANKKNGYSPTKAMRDYGIKTLGNNISKAKAISLAREDPELFYELLGGPKVSNFSQNILDDEPMDEEGYYVHPNGDWTQHRDLGGTIDAHHMRASSMAHGAWEKKGYHGDEIDPETGKKINRSISPSNTFTYDTFNRGLFEATKRINASIEDPRKHLTPKQVQAIIWIKHKEDNDRFSRMRFRGEDGKWKPIKHESQITPEGIADYEKRMAQAKARAERKAQQQAAQGIVAQRFWQAGIQRVDIHTGGIKDDKYPQEWIDGAEQLARDTGGFTIRDDPNMPGDAPTSGYQVAIPGYERTDINTGQGWADYAHEINPVLQGTDVALGTWHNPYDALYYTEPSETIHDYDDAARATVERNQWSMWDNGAYTVDPKNNKKNFFPQADIPRHEIINQGLAGVTGFTLAKNQGITYSSNTFQRVKPFWEG